MFSNMLMQDSSRGDTNMGGKGGSGGGGGGGGRSELGDPNRVTDSLALREYEAERVDNAFLMMVFYSIPHIP